MLDFKIVFLIPSHLIATDM